MRQRTLLIAALVLMAGGLLLGGVGLVFGQGATPVRSQQAVGPRWQQGPAGGFRPVRPGFDPGMAPGGGTWRRIPGMPGIPRTPASPKPTPTA